MPLLPHSFRIFGTAFRGPGGRPLSGGIRAGRRACSVVSSQRRAVPSSRAGQVAVRITCSGSRQVRFVSSGAAVTSSRRCGQAGRGGTKLRKGDRGVFAGAVRDQQQKPRPAESQFSRRARPCRVVLVDRRLEHSFASFGPRVAPGESATRRLPRSASTQSNQRTVGGAMNGRADLAAQIGTRRAQAGQSSAGLARVDRQCAPEAANVAEVPRPEETGDVVRTSRQPGRRRRRGGSPSNHRPRMATPAAAPTAPSAAWTGPDA